ncbi:hypothetical protein T11_17002 [Trichinella zimbabwensis]|uniref:Uncharacterized protein n=1 Tax=Trichinella zimbabwensis TaxID=268475 RepID=A0A0V1GVV3_9BILA|nr:hypothetical protein T11_17002 [Trichinella zimbabwensis]
MYLRQQGKSTEQPPPKSACKVKIMNKSVVMSSTSQAARGKRRKSETKKALASHRKTTKQKNHLKGKKSKSRHSRSPSRSKQRSRSRSRSRSHSRSRRS